MAVAQASVTDVSDGVLTYTRWIPVTLLALKLTLVPALVGAVTLATRQWGLHIGGLLAALPLVAGPTLFFYTIEQGDAFAADAARAAMLGIAAIGAFCAAYSRAADRLPWPASAAAGLAAFGVAALVVHRIDAAGVGEFALAVASLFLAHACLPAGSVPAASGPPPAWDVPMRMVAAAAVVITLTALAGTFGSTISGVLSAFPIVTLVLTVFTHVQRGAPAAAAFLVGVLRGLNGFALFCLVLSTALGPLHWGLALSLVAALSAQMAFQALLLWRVTTTARE